MKARLSVWKGKVREWMDERITGKILVIITHYISMVGGTNANKCVTKETNYVVDCKLKRSLLYFGSFVADKLFTFGLLFKCRRIFLRRFCTYLGHSP